MMKLTRQGIGSKAAGATGHISRTKGGIGKKLGIRMQIEKSRKVGGAIREGNDVGSNNSSGKELRREEQLMGK